MSRHADIKDIEHRVRSCMAYHAWVERNMATACLCCDTTEDLQVHHIVELYHILLGLWKLYGDADSVVTHAQVMHIENHCEGVTLCEKCHKKLHPGRHLVFQNQQVRIEEWSTMPRKLPGPLIHHPSKANGHGLTLISAQLLAGIGWYILNGQLEGFIVDFKRSAMARLLGKEPGSSFNNCLKRALVSLKDLNVLEAFHAAGPEIEVHLSKAYLQQLYDLPWFMAMPDVRTSKMPVFALRWFLGCQSGRRNYKIGKDKLVANMGLQTSTPAFVERCVKKACEETEWAHADFDGTYFSFRLRRRGAVPIWSLRSLVRDAIREGS